MLNLKQTDKQLHVLAGIIIAGFLYPFIGYYAVVVSIAVGLLKEYVVDVIWPFGEPDIWDAVATALGALLVGAFAGLAELAQRFILS
jgi:hypothetical protein